MAVNMAPSRVGTVSVPGIATNSPAGFAHANLRPLRVAVHNVGGAPLRLAFESASLGSSSSDTVDHYQLPIDKQQVFIVAPGQTLYVVAVGAGGNLTYTSSDALPFESGD